MIRKDKKIDWGLMTAFLLNVGYGFIKFIKMDTVQNCSTSYVGEFVGFFVAVVVFIISEIISECIERNTTALKDRDERQK